jgi:hypothetical protein
MLVGVAPEVRKCPLKRCHGRRGCLCPSGQLAVGTYSSRVGESVTEAVYQGKPTLDAGRGSEGSDGATKLPPLLNQKRAVTNAGQKILSQRGQKQETVAISAGKMDTFKRSLPPPITQQGAPQQALQIAEDSRPMDISPPFSASEQNGTVTVRYNHYKKSFPVVHGSLTADVLDQEYAISFAYPNCRLHLTLYSPSDFSFEEKLGTTVRPLVQEGPQGTFIGLTCNETYWIDIEEDHAERVAYEERQAELALKSAKKREAAEARENDPLRIETTKLESCSCIEGNPCVDAYCCKDFSNRYEVAKKHGWKGF